MGYQKLIGIKVTAFESRFPSSATPSKAFGGWIFNANVEMGFSQQPTSISLEIALDTQGGEYKANGLDFDILPSDLNVSYGGGKNDYYEIELGSKKYKPMFLSSYEISSSSDSKVLKVNFVDYSIILDKIQIAIFKKQDYKTAFKRTFSTSPRVDALCPGCSLEDDTFYHVTVNQDLNKTRMVNNVEAGFYFYNHAHAGGFDLFAPDDASQTKNLLAGLKAKGKTAKFFPNTIKKLIPEGFHDYSLRHYMSGATFDEWNSAEQGGVAKNSPQNPGRFDINGGTLVVGVEEFNQSVCGSAANVSYNFTELICSLAKSGLNFSKINSLDHLSSVNYVAKAIDKNKHYRKNYSGTLREVLNNWCADFALDYYVLGTRIHFIDLADKGGKQLEKDMDELFEIVKPSSALGAGLNSDKNYAIGSFTESADILDTYEQRLVTFRVKPKKKEERTKEKKNNCGFLAMHSLDFLLPNMDQGSNFLTMFDETYERPVLLNNIWASPGLRKRHWYSNRTFEAIDKCAAIGKYSEIYRNIYAASLITKADGVLNGECMDGFNSFGFMPLYRLHEEDDEEIRTELIEQAFKQEDAETQQYIIDQKTFDVWLGFGNEEEAKEIVSWEKSVAENMYRYGVLVKGPHKFYGNPVPPAPGTIGGPVTPVKDSPFVSDDFAAQAAPNLGLDSGSLKLLKTETSSTPSFVKYRFFEDLPFKDLFRSVAEFQRTAVDLRSLPIASLDNDWGTDQTEFDEKLKVVNHASANCNNHGQPKLLDDGDLDGAENTPDSFSVKDFAPKFIDLPDDFFENEDFSDLKKIIANTPAAAALLGKLIITQKEASGVKYTQAQCPKLQIMIIPRVVGNTKINPHLLVNFAYSTGKNAMQEVAYFKGLYLEKLEKGKDFVKTKCDYSIEEIICNIGTTAQGLCKDYAADEPNCQCYTPLNEKDPPGVYAMGFPKKDNFLSRMITINISVHHGVQSYLDADIKPLPGGGVGYMANDEDYPTFTQVSKSASIIYPLESDDISSDGTNTPVTQDNLYQGVITQRATFQLRSSETVECYGSHWNGKSNVAKVQLINNQVSQEIEKLMDSSLGIISPVYDIQGNKVVSVSDYHKLMESLSDPSLTANTKPSRSFSLEVIGNALGLAALQPYLSPEKGLKSLSFSLGSQGFRSKLMFSNRAAKLPKPEAIMNIVRVSSS